MAEIGFYHLQRSRIETALPKLLEKALAAGFRAVVRVPDEAAMARLDLALWTYDKESFLPHGTAAQAFAEAQPVLITIEPRRPNEADLLVQAYGAEWGELAPFRRVLDLFDGAEEAATAAARERWRRYREAGHDIAYWQERHPAGWERKA